MKKVDETKVLGWLGMVVLFGFFLWRTNVESLWRGFVPQLNAWLTGVTVIAEGIGRAVMFLVDILAGAASFLVGACLTWFGFTVLRSKRDLRTIRILPHVRTTVNKQAVRSLIHQFANLRRPWYKRFLRGREWFRLTVSMDDKGIAFFMSVPKDRLFAAKRAWQTAYPRCEIHDVNRFPVPEITGPGGHFTLMLKGARKGLPLMAFGGPSELGDILSFMEPGSWMDVQFSPGSPVRMRRRVRRALKAIRFSEKTCFPSANL